MKLIIFGATGSVGRHLVAQALEAGHQVTGFARKPSQLEHQHENFTAFTGDVLDESSVAQAICGHDAVLIALGAGRKGSLRSIGTRNIVKAMTDQGIRRLVCMSTLGAGESRANLNFFWKHIMFGLLLREAYADHQAQEAIIRQSKLDWTMVRPGAFIDGPTTGNYQHGFSPEQKGLKLKISRADVAEFILRLVKDHSYLHQAPALSY